MRNSRIYRADALLLLTAIIWGFAFVAQRAGMEYVGPYTYNALRFALGGLSLMPLLLLPINKKKLSGKKSYSLLIYGSIAGLALFLGSSFQQVGLLHTTAGNAGFITGLYVIFVPIIGLFRKENAGAGVWIGATLAVAGMYFLSINENFQINEGDFYILICAIFFAIHVIIIAWLSPKFNTVRLSIIQFFIVAIISLLIAIIQEEILWINIKNATIPILYGGILSAGVAYTLQVYAQKDAPPSHAVIILSLESVFALFGGWLILHETVSDRSLLGCGLMLSGILFSQIFQHKNRKQ